MFKNVFAAALTIGIVTIAIAPAASAAASYNTLNGWSHFAEETATPVSLDSQNIDWANLYSNRASSSLREWKRFAEETATPAPASLYSQNVDWKNLYR